MELDFQFFGDKEMEQVFKALPERMQNRVLVSAVRGGGSVIVKKARENLVAKGSIRTGLLHRSIGVRVKNYKKDGVVYGAVGSRRSVIGTTAKGRQIIPANYAYLVEVEFGTAKKKAKPFLRPALDQGRAAVFAELTKRGRKGLAREIKKLRKATS